MLSAPIKDQSLSLEVEQWLQNNKATVIPRGASTATGWTPPPPSERTPKESKKRIVEINQIVKAEKEAAKAAAKAKYEAQKAKRAENMRKTREAERKKIYAELVEVMRDFRGKAGHGDLRRLVCMVGMTERAFRAIEVGERSTTRKRLNQIKGILENFVYIKDIPKPKPEPKPKKPKLTFSSINAESKAKAIESGSKEFLGTCLTHGETLLKIRGVRNKLICPRCHPDNKPKKMVFPGLNCRLNYNKSLRDIAAANNEKEFIGFCDKHGEEKYFLTKTGYQCRVCSVEKQQRAWDKEKQARKERKQKPLSRLQINTIRKKEAIAMNDKHFIGICERHGETTYSVTTDGRCKCMKCNREHERKRRRISDNPRLNATKLNRELMMSIIDSGLPQKTFTGVCHKHGETVFIIKPAKNTKSGYTYACKACKNNVKI